jgi:hypothetical protein
MTRTLIAIAVVGAMTACGDDVTATPDGGGAGVDAGRDGADGGPSMGTDGGRTTGPLEGTLCGTCLATDPPTCASPDAACLSNRDTGQMFCAQACPDAMCPAGFICSTIPSAPAPQCVPESGLCDMGPPPPPVDLDAGCGVPIETEELALTNAARATAGLEPLVCDDILARAARLHSQDQCEQGMYTHVGSDGSRVADRVTRLGGTFTAIGENVAMGQTTAARVHQDWMDSVAHRDNILAPAYGRIGIGYVPCGGTPLWTQDFTD